MNQQSDLADSTLSLQDQNKGRYNHTYAWLFTFVIHVSRRKLPVENSYTSSSFPLAISAFTFGSHARYSIELKNPRRCQERNINHESTSTANDGIKRTLQCSSLNLSVPRPDWPCLLLAEYVVARMRNRARRPIRVKKKPIIFKYIYWPFSDCF